MLNKKKTWFGDNPMKFTIFASFKSINSNLKNVDNNERVCLLEKVVILREILVVVFHILYQWM